jgi:hypothetical protein
LSKHVVGNLELAAGLMPTRPVEHHNGVTAWGDVAADLGEMQVHGFAVGHRHDESGADVARGTNRSEQVGPIVALVARRPRPTSAFGPNPCQRAVLADAGLVLPPQLDRLVLRMRRDDGSDQIGKVFLSAS